VPFKRSSVCALILLAMLLPPKASCTEPDGAAVEHPNSEQVMLVLRGIGNSENPRGQLDDRSALEYARRVGFRGEVLDVAADPSSDSEQLRMAVELLRRDENISAIYGFSGGGYNVRLIWQQLTPAERDRIRKLVVIGAPGVAITDFAGASEVVIKPDPPEGHMDGPKSLLQSLAPKDLEATQ
jgi:hypothetical protein